MASEARKPTGRRCRLPPAMLAAVLILSTPLSPSRAQDTPLPDVIDRALGLGRDGPEGSSRTGVRGGIPFLVRFKGTVGGLEPGAPVRVRGMRMGAVREVRASFDPAAGDFDIPVVIELDPAPFVGAGGDPAAAGPGPVHEAVAALVRRGVRARLGNGNLVTAETIVRLDDVRDAAPAELRLEGPMPEIPTVEVPFVSVQDAIARALAGGGGGTTAALGRVAAEAEATLASARRLLDDPGLPALVAALARTGEGVAPLAAALGERAGPIAEGVEGVMRSAPGLATRAATTLAKVDRLLAQTGDLPAELEDLLRQSAAALRSFRALADLVERDPQAFVRGKSGTAP